MKRFLQLNCQGAFRYKYLEVVDWCSENQGVLAAVSETKLCEPSCERPHQCAEVPPVVGWSWVSRPRNIEGGGVGILIRDSVKFRHRVDLRTEGVEDEWIEIFSATGRESYLVCSVYIPPNSVAEMCKFRTTVETVCAQHMQVIVMGDLNSRCLSLGDEKDSVLTPFFQELVDSSNLHICNEFGVKTRQGKSRETDSILDVSLVSRTLEKDVSEWGVHEEFSSDHYGVSFSIRLPGVRPQFQKRWKVWDFSAADWQMFRTLVGEELESWRERVEREMQLDEASELFAIAIQRAASKAVPQKTLTERSRPGISKKAQELITERKRAVRVKKKYDTTWIRERITEITRKIKAEMRAEAKRRVEEMFGSGERLTRDEMWSKFQKITRRGTPQIKVLKHKGEILTEKSEIAEAMAEYFSEVGADSKEDSFNEMHRREVEELLARHDFTQESKEEINEPFSEEEVRKQVRTLNVHKATGPDGVHN